MVRSLGVETRVDGVQDGVADRTGRVGTDANGSVREGKARESRLTAEFGWTCTSRGGSRRRRMARTT
eukprot:scaffold153_cov347-Pavlova_lutheri.AAC.31